MVPFDMQRLYEPKHPEVLRINPKRQVPVLIHDGLEIFDSTQIFEYLEDAQAGACAVAGRARRGPAPACSNTSPTRSISRTSSG